MTINVFQSQAQTTAQVVQRASSDLAKQLDAIAKLCAKASEAKPAEGQAASSGKAASVGDIANANANLLNQALQKSRATSGTGEVIGAFTTGSANFASGAAAKPATGQAAAAPAASQAAAAKPAGGQSFAFAGAIDVDKFNAAFSAATGTKANFTADQIKDGLNQFNRNQTTRSATLQNAANSAEVSRSGTAPTSSPVGGSPAGGTTATATRDAQTGAAQVRIDFQGGSRTLDVAQFNKSLSQQTGTKANFTGEQIAQALNGDQKAVFGGAAGGSSGTGAGSGANSGAAAKPAAPQQPAKLASETTLELLFAAQSSGNAASSKSGSAAYGAVAPQLSATQSQNRLLNLLS